MSEATVDDQAVEPNRAYLRQAWLVLLLAILYGGGLAAVQWGLGDTIAANRLAETTSQIPRLVPGATGGVDRSDELPPALDERLFQALDDDGQTVGWVVVTGGQGFADEIEMLVGLDPAADTITGIYVLSQKETPGLGDYIATERFLERVAGKPADGSLQAVKRDPRAAGEFRVWTGATVSSVAVSDIINAGLAAVKPHIATIATIDTIDTAVTGQERP